MTLLYLALAYLLGIVLGRLAWDAGLFGCGLAGWLWWPPLALLPLTAWLKPPRLSAASMRWPVTAGFKPPPRGIAPGIVAGAALCVLAGGLRYATQPLTPCWTPADLATRNLPAAAAFDRSAPQVTVQGYVDDFPLFQNDRQEVVVAVEQLVENGATHVVTGRARLLTDRLPRYAYGDRVTVTGRVATPPDFEDFSYREYLARRGIHSLIYSAQVDRLPGAPGGTAWRRWAATVRSRGLALLQASLPEPQASLAAGMLLGVEAGIPDAVYDRFHATGTSHVIVISGSNVALIAGMLLAAFGRVLGRRAVIPALVGIAVYAVVVGGDATVVCAAIMGGLVVAAVGLQRRSTGLVSLAAAVWVMALVNPGVVWDVGLQLSAAATVGLILFAAKLQKWLEAHWPSLQGGALTGTTAPRPGGSGLGGLLRGVVVDGGVITVAATLLTLPLVAFHFHRVSLVGLLANLLIVPVQPLILTAGTAGVGLGVAGVPWLPQGLLWAAWLGLWWTERVVSLVAAWPGASWSMSSFGLPALATTYAVIGLVAARDRLPAWRVTFAGPTGAAWLIRTPALLILCVLAGLSVLAAAALPDGKLHVVFLDVGQGDAIWIQTPGGRQALVDGGASPSVLVNELGAVMPFWDRSLDLAALTHADADHMDGQTELPARLTLAGALTTDAALASPDAADWRRAMQAGGVTVTPLAAGAWIDFGDGVTLHVLNPDPAGYIGPDPDNENSLVMRLEYGTFRALLTGDAGLPSEAAWLAAGAPLASTVLKVGHHGSKTSTGPDFVAAVQPQVAVIQVGADNRYGHPTDATLAKLAATTVLRTDLDGRVEVVSDGAWMWVRTARSRPGARR